MFQPNQMELATNGTILIKSSNVCIDDVCILGIFRNIPPHRLYNGATECNIGNHTQNSKSKCGSGNPGAP